jgi:hypothetical protein
MGLIQVTTPSATLTNDETVITILTFWTFHEKDK